MKTKTYNIVDAKGELVADGFKSERAAYRARDVYRDHCSDVTLPLRVVPAEEEKAEGIDLRRSSGL